MHTSSRLRQVPETHVAPHRFRTLPLHSGKALFARMRRLAPEITRHIVADQGSKRCVALALEWCDWRT
jgi:hypothetical protein